ncbi:GntR family transcriptional regulator [Verminephrobacter aporrectodeae subsp. tuberculatae]|uniref:GntR family transcriptional regulator n=1 Tax=Verminephrobacter aporrectodeae subsp. tuberculatae TaxID=1110392 RepID=A0ABT3KVI9_9BURK|nr:GntR family transcriptional regulator [Verminephrobacter aporrectodeae]MCW5322356.1 GntR family transcriptional regulator [Verminephrobacter aporrectodeae subsp. tuberculatae]MCW8166235.1 GntR family transcriptional regulator [Verminephrobacter aporrectodeae subsp. tuberculatae]MCW8169770.1 GntR family transcriptional regulator [Verminephrobacter aporrectodeae subsp. tuberculatae]MCW8207860.1 GntR family transcriptional regulator [Verminephrobacter aporrectodeae subsp. tuberculatae]
MTPANDLLNSSHLYAVIAEVLDEHIRIGRLPPGLVLLEKPIAEVFQTSRAPVRRALAELESRQLIQRFDGRGFLVGPPAQSVRPIRTPFKALNLSLGAQADAALQTRTSWERIYAEVERSVASCLVFGQYRIVEAELAEHYRVSRTVARDVLSRLQERGLVRKNQSSHWVAGPLTAKDIRELYELRTALEPVALRGAMQQTPRATLQALRARCTGRDPSQWTAEMIDRIESDLHESLLLATTNDRLAENLRHVQLPLVETERFLRSLGLPMDPRIVDEHRIIYELLLHDAVDAAAAALIEHLHAESRRSLIHLKTAAVFSDPPPLASYLARRVDD